MHQAVSMQWERMSNLWHTRKWKSLYLGPDWSPAPKFLNQTSCPTQPHHHNLVDRFQEAIDSNDISGIKLVLDQPILTGTTCTDFLKYNRTELTSLKITAEKIVASTIQPPPTPIAQQPQQHHQPQTFGLKTPRMETPTWNGDRYSFYSWLSSCSKSFDQSNCNNIAITQLMLQAMPLDKKSSFNHIDGWEEFKSKLLNKFGNLEVFRREALK